MQATVPPSAVAFYRTAIIATAQAAQPAYMTYMLKSEPGTGYELRLMSLRHRVWIQPYRGVDAQVFRMQHRTRDYSTQIVDPDGKRWVTARSFFDPTWYGSYRALRDGMLGYQDNAPPLPDAHPTPQPVALKTIAAVHVMGPSIYGVQDAGAATCANGDAGHALRLFGHDHDPRHQLARVVVDLRNMRFCSLRFDLPPSALGFAGYVEQEYGDVNGYWVQIGGEINGSTRVLGIAVNSGAWRYTLEEIAFPKSIAAAEFVAPSTQ